MRITLVIVDDAPFIREAVRGLIRDTEIELLGEASDGEDAVKVVAAKNPDVVLMDMVMPRKNGIEATKEILEANAKIKIVACSTEGQENMILKALEAGCCSFLAKPFKSAELLNAIRSAKGASI